MMCKPCKVAGEAHDEFRRRLNSGAASEDWKRTRRFEIQDMHVLCEQPASCTCLHRVLSKDEQKKRQAVQVTVAM